MVASNHPTESSSEGCVLGIDVGTGSARAGVFDLAGRLLGHASTPTETHQPEAEFYEQSSRNIWEAVCASTRSALCASGAAAESVLGIGVDATSCSLVALDAEDRPLGVSPGGEAKWNVILWMDHRAQEEAALCNATGHEVLRYVGGTLSPEMAPAKLLWLKRHSPRTWSQARRFLDLVDFLVYRATGEDVRSLCTTVCKWTYLGHRRGGGWARDFFAAIGLDDLFAGDRQGARVEPMGKPAGHLTARAADELGLRPDIPVGVGIIDAHAGGLGLLGAAFGERSGRNDAAPERGDAERIEHALALIGGTSSCHMAVSREPRFIRGVWGPYFSAMVPGLWLTEGGQSATGSLIDHVIGDAAAAPELRRLAAERGQTVYDVLNAEVERLAGRRGVPPCELTRDLHVLPYFLGNRSPRADPSLRGVISGLGLDASLSALALRYLAAVQAVAYGTRHIIEALNGGGYRIDAVLACGGGTRNALWLREHADITGCRLHLPREPEAVLLGAAILGAVAGGRYAGVLEAMRAMGGAGAVVGADPAHRAYHDRKYRVFHRLHDQFLELRQWMSEAP